MRTLVRGRRSLAVHALSFALLAALLLALGGCGGGSSGDDTQGTDDAGTIGQPDVGGAPDTAVEDVAKDGLSVRIVSPEPGTVVPPETAIDLVAEVRFPGRAMWGLNAVWTSDVMGEIGESRPNDAGQAIVTRVALVGGPHRLRVTVSDDSGPESDSAEVEIYVRRRPGAPVIHIEPEAPHGDADLEVVIDQDALVDDDAVLSYRYRWRVDGEIAVGQTDAVLPAVVTNRGEEWEVAVTPVADDVEGTPALASVTILNSLPTVDSVQVFPNVATSDATLNCQPMGAADLDGDEVTFAYTWLVNGDEVASGADPADASLTGASFERGDDVVCVVTPFDGTDEGAPVASADIPVVNSAPWVDGASVTPDGGATSTEFRCVPAGAGDSDGDEITFRWTWYADGEEILGAASETFTPIMLARNQMLGCGVVADDGWDQSPEVRSPEVRIGNTPPAVENVFVRPPTGTARDTFTCEATGGTDADGDEVSYRYAWYVEGLLIEGQIAETLDGTAGTWFSRGDEIYCEATPFDGIDFGAPVQSKNRVTVANAAPFLTAAALDPPEGDMNTTFTCRTIGWDDPDTGDDEVTFYRWLLDDVEVPGENGPMFQGELIPWATLVCEATPFDGLDYGPPVRSSGAVIANEPPSLTSATLGPEDPTRESVLECVPSGWYDREDAPPGYRFVWHVNSGIVEGEEGPTLDGSLLRRGDVVLCQVYPDDGLQEGEPVWSNAVSVGNAAPGVGTVQLIPGAGNHYTEFSCVADQVTDADEDGVFFLYSWFINGERIEGANQETHIQSEFTIGDRLQCRAVPTDGIDDGQGMMSNEALLTNALPSVASVVVTPSPAIVTDTLVCTADGWTDADGDAPGYRYRWLLNEEELPEEVSAELASGVFVKHDELVCEVTPFDGYTAGPARLSPIVPILNSPPTAAGVDIVGVEIDMTLWFECIVASVGDLDGDTVGLSYVWFANGEIIDGETTELISSAAFSEDDRLACEVTPNDGEEDGAPVRSADLLLNNQPPHAEILRPEPGVFELQSGTYVEFRGRVWDEEDPASSLRVQWWSDKDGLLSEAPPDAAGLTSFHTNELSQGIHIIYLRVWDTLLAEGEAHSVLNVVPVCGETGYVGDDGTFLWTDGDFESGDLTRWSFANRKYVAANGYRYMMSACDTPQEFLIDPIAAQNGEVGLWIDLPAQPTDVFSVAKRFPEDFPVGAISVECSVFPIERVSIQFGFFHEGEDGTLYSGGAVLLTNDESLTFLPPGPANTGSFTDPGGHELPIGEWSIISIFRDLSDSQFLYYENSRQWLDLTLTDNRRPAGFGIGMSSSGGALQGYIDDCRYILYEAPAK